MTRFSSTAAVLAVAALAAAGCTTYKVEPAPRAPVTSSTGAPVMSSSAPVASAAPAPQAGLRSGYGVVESISLVNPPSASTGGPAVVSAPYRLTVRMDDNKIGRAHV